MSSIAAEWLLAFFWGTVQRSNPTAFHDGSLTPTIVCNLIKTLNVLCKNLMDHKYMKTEMETIHPAYGLHPTCPVIDFLQMGQVFGVARFPMHLSMQFLQNRCPHRRVTQ